MEKFEEMMRKQNEKEKEERDKQADTESLTNGLIPKVNSKVQ